MEISEQQLKLQDDGSILQLAKMIRDGKIVYKAMYNTFPYNSVTIDQDVFDTSMEFMNPEPFIDRFDDIEIQLYTAKKL